MIEAEVSVRFIHFMAAVVAVGGVLSTDLINAYKFLHPENFDYDIRVEKLFSLMIWTGLYVLAVTGTIIYIGMPEAVLSSAFQLKMLVVALLFLNGIFLNRWVQPRFEKIQEDQEKDIGDNRYFELIAGASALLSVASWMIALAIGYF